MGWRDLGSKELVEKMEKMEKTKELFPLTVPISVTDKTPEPDKENNQADPFLLDLLDEDQAEYYHALVDIMANPTEKMLARDPKLKLTRAEAEIRAAEIVARAVTPLQIQRSAEEYKKNGFIKIYSTKLETSFYLVKDQATAAKVPDLTLGIITQHDLEAVSDRNIPTDTRLEILHTKLLFGGSIKVEDCNSKEWEARIREKKR